MNINKLRIGFVFTNYNNSNVTRDAVESIYQHELLKDCPVIVVDNNSDSENADILRKIIQSFKNVTIITNKENLGYFKGLNVGMRYLRKLIDKIEIVVIGNNDLVFPSTFINALQKNANLFEIYPVISPNIVTLDGIHQNPHVIYKISKFRELIFDIYFSNFYLANIINFVARVTKSFTDRKDEQQHEFARPIYQGYGACYILTPVFFRNFDDLWAPTFMMGEEFFLSKQLESRNFQIYYEPSIIVNHQHHGTLGKMPERKIWNLKRESHHLYRKYVSVWK